MSIGRQDYTERKEARIARLEERADKAQAASDAAVKASHDAVAGIPFGQPILVDHYSANSHRRALERSRKNMDKAVALDKKADRLQARAEAARDNAAISGDDPDALQKLQAKLAALQAAQEQDKARNAYWRKHKTMIGCPGVPDELARMMDKTYNDPQSLERQPAAPYTLSNRSAEMRRLQDRIKQLQAVDEMDAAEIEFDGGRIVTNEAINRVQILFDEKPDEDTRRKLKSYGFRWSPREGAWQAQRTPRNLRFACHALGIQAPQPKTEAQPAAAADPAPIQDEQPAPTPAADDRPHETEIAPGFFQASLI